MDFSMLNYHTEYGFEISDRKMEMSSNEVCFSRIYGYLNNQEAQEHSGNIKIAINKDAKSYLRLNKDNNCFLTRNEINYYLRFLNRLTDTTKYLKIKLSMKNSNDSFGIKIKLNNASTYESRVAPALVRMMYEFPFCVQLKTAFAIKNIKEFKHLDFGERLCLSLNSINLNRDVHSIYDYNAKIMKTSEIEEVFNNKNDRNVTDFIGRYDGDANWKQLDKDVHKKSIENAANGIIDNQLKEILIKIYDKAKR